MVGGLEAHRGLYQPHEWQRLLKRSAVYAQSLEERLSGGAANTTTTGEEILRITLSKIKTGCDGYMFKDGDILLYHYLCRCCRNTVLSLHGQFSPARTGPHGPCDAEHDAPAVLTEAAAVAFLERRRDLEAFQGFVKGKKLKGKLRAYSAGFPRFAAEKSNTDCIAKELRVTAETVASYRSRLRELLEEFEIARLRRHQA